MDDQGGFHWIFSPLFEVVAFCICVTPLLLRTSLTLLTGEMLLRRSRYAWNQVLILGHLVYHSLRITSQEEKHNFDPLLLVLIAYMYFVATFPRADNASGENTRLIMLLCCCLSGLYAWRFYCAFKALRTFSQHCVSKKKRRFIDKRHGIDLDLSYISPHIIAMGFPTEKLLEQQLRNPMEQVKKFFASRHPGHYKVYNLCSERTYTHKSFVHEYHRVRFPDHNPCTLADLQTICKDMEAFLRKHRGRNVVAVHCKAGKGRTGLVVSSLLLHLRICSRADEALALFARRRTYDGKGVTIPSQIRCVHHYEAVVREGKVRDPWPLRLTRVEVSPKPAEHWDFQILTHEEGVIFDTTRHEGSPPVLRGDVKVAFFRGTQKLFQLWMHTAYDTQPGDPLAWAETTEDMPAVVWACNRPEDRPPWESSCFQCFRRQQLDGPHKKKKNKVGTLEQVQLFFVRVPCEEERQAQKVTHKSTSELDADGMEDYDDLENDTDHDELLGSLCRGYLLRRTSRFMRPQQRLCELHTSGRLHIAGDNGMFLGTLETLVVDLSQGDESVLRELDRDREGPRAWRVRNPHARTWETLEATDPGEASRWEQSFADAVRLGRAARDPLTSFAGFFWKLNANMDAMPIPGTFEMEHWRIRLFVLRRDGNMLVYSHKTRSEVVFCNFCSPGCELVPLPRKWRGMEHIVLFQLAIGGANPTRRTFAVAHEAFGPFAERVSALQRSAFCGGGFPAAA